jgi:TetR/AcrR family transcriptional regulator, tetracycline repressor protein
MGRPPLISREQVARAALRLIDDGGVERFSLEQLADACGVKAPSLYHHFADKTEILIEVVRTVLLEIPLFDLPPTADWREWLVDETVEFRRALLRHPGALKLVVEYFPPRQLVRLFDHYSTKLQEAGVPLEYHFFLLEATYRMTMGSALCAASGNEAFSIGAHVDRDRDPYLFRVFSLNKWTDESLFADSIRLFLAGLNDEISGQPSSSRGPVRSVRSGQRAASAGARSRP